MAVDQLLSKDEARARIFGPDADLGSASGAISDDPHENEHMPYPDEDDGDDWDFADGPVDPHVEVRASHRQDFDAIHELCQSATVAVP